MPKEVTNIAAKAAQSPIQFGLRFDRFQTTHFAFAPPLEVENQASVTFASEPAALIDTDTQRIVIRLRIQVFVEGREGEPLGQIQTVSEFAVEGLSRLPVNGEQVQVPDKLMATLFNLALGATRGAMATRGAGSALERYIFPIVDPMELLRNADGLVREGSAQATDKKRKRRHTDV